MGDGCKGLYRSLPRGSEPSDSTHVSQFPSAGIDPTVKSSKNSVRLLITCHASGWAVFVERWHIFTSIGVIGKSVSNQPADAGRGPPRHAADHAKPGDHILEPRQAGGGEGTARGGAAGDAADPG